MAKTNFEIKKDLINLCIELLNEKKVHYEKEMEEAQHEANQFKGAMESRYDTFKEELQEKKNHLAVQLNQVLNDIIIIKKIQPSLQESVRISSVVEIMDENSLISNYFIFSSFSSSPIIIDSKSYKLLNLSSPLGTVLKDKKINSVITFNKKQITITDLY